MPTEKLTFLPSFTEPPIINAQSRLRQLREMLLDESIAFQHNNISFLIQLYESGQLPPAPGKEVWIMDGKIVDGPLAPEEFPKGAVLWVEVHLLLILSYYFTYLTFSEWLFSLCRRLRHHRRGLTMVVDIVRTHRLTVIIDCSCANETVAVQMGQSASYGISALSNMHEVSYKPSSKSSF